MSQTITILYLYRLIKAHINSWCVCQNTKSDSFWWHCLGTPCTEGGCVCVGGWGVVLCNLWDQLRTQQRDWVWYRRALQTILQLCSLCEAIKMQRKCRSSRENTFFRFRPSIFLKGSIQWRLCHHVCPEGPTAAPGPTRKYDHVGPVLPGPAVWTRPSHPNHPELTLS